MPSASAASVPGSSARCSWHFSAVWLRYGIDGDQLGAAPLRFLHAAPEVQVRDDRVRAPDHDQLRILELLEVGADRRADGRGVAGLAGGRADRAIEQRRAEPVEKAAVHRAVLQQSHRAGVAVRQDRLRPVGRCGDRRKRCGDGVERFVPGDALERAFALCADALHRIQHALVGIRAIEVARDLGAEHAVASRMIGIALDLDRAAVLAPSRASAQVSGQSCGHAPRTMRVTRTQGESTIEWHRMNRGDRHCSPRLIGAAARGLGRMVAISSHRASARMPGRTIPRSPCRLERHARARSGHLENGRAARAARAEVAALRWASISA